MQSDLRRCRSVACSSSQKVRSSLAPWPQRQARSMTSGSSRFGRKSPEWPSHRRRGNRVQKYRLSRRCRRSQPSPGRRARRSDGDSNDLGALGPSFSHEHDCATGRADPPNCIVTWSVVLVVGSRVSVGPTSGGCERTMALAGSDWIKAVPLNFDVAHDQRRVEAD